MRSLANCVISNILTIFRSTDSSNVVGLTIHESNKQFRTNQIIFTYKNATQKLTAWQFRPSWQQRKSPWQQSGCWLGAVSSRLWHGALSSAPPTWNASTSWSLCQLPGPWKSSWVALATFHAPEVIGLLYWSSARELRGFVVFWNHATAFAICREKLQTVVPLWALEGISLFFLFFFFLANSSLQ